MVVLRLGSSASAVPVATSVGARSTCVGSKFAGSARNLRPDCGRSPLHSFPSGFPPAPAMCAPHRSPAAGSGARRRSAPACWRRTGLWGRRWRCGQPDAQAVPGEGDSDIARRTAQISVKGVRIHGFGAVGAGAVHARAAEHDGLQVLQTARLRDRRARGGVRSSSAADIRPWHRHRRRASKRASAASPNMVRPTAKPLHSGCSLARVMLARTSACGQQTKQQHAATMGSWSRSPCSTRPIPPPSCRPRAQAASTNRGKYPPRRPVSSSGRGWSYPWACRRVG